MVPCPRPASADGQPAPCQLSTAERREGQCRVQQITCATCGGAWNVAGPAGDTPGDAPAPEAEEQPLEPPRVGPAFPPGPYNDFGS